MSQKDILTVLFSFFSYSIYSTSHQLSHTGLDVFDGKLVQQEQAGQNSWVFLGCSCFLTQLSVDVLDAAVS